MKRKPLISDLASRAQKPKGFTLLEVLVVIGIIAFLVSMTVSVVRGVITSSRVKATKTTIKKIDGLLTQRMDSFTIGRKAQNLNGQDRAAVVRQKNLFKAGFPQTLAEAGQTVPANDDPTTQSSEAMYLFLTKMEIFGQPAGDEDAFSSSEVKDTDNDGFMEFVDNWGRPLRFYRWPTRLIRPAPQGQESDHQDIKGTSPNEYYEFPLDPDFGGSGYGAQLLLGPIQPLPAGSQSRKAVNAQPTLADEVNDPLARDPDDPFNRYLAPNSTAVQNFEHTYHTPATWSTPLILSVGEDEVLGLYEPGDDTNHGFLAQPNYSELEGLLDNITNRNISP